MEKGKGKGRKFAGFVLMESITNRLPYKIRHALFVFYEKPLVIASDYNWKFNSLIGEASKTRWRHSEPNDELTWGIEVSGDGFVRKVSSYNVFGPDKTLLEVGPGKGRILKSLIRLEIPYGRYLGIDISTKNIMYLQEQFPGNKHKFIVDDIETMQLHDNFDVLLSSLTFKHFFPSFKKALLNVSRHMNPNAMIFFDLPEGKLRVFHKGTYLRWYTKSEVKDILGECHLEIVAFGHVVHGSSARRLLIVAKSSRAKLSEAPTALPSYASAPFSRGENS